MDDLVPQALARGPATSFDVAGWRHFNTHAPPNERPLFVRSPLPVHTAPLGRVPELRRLSHVAFTSPPHSPPVLVVCLASDVQNWVGHHRRPPHREATCPAASRHMRIGVAHHEVPGSHPQGHTTSVRRSPAVHAECCGYRPDGNTFRRRRRRAVDRPSRRRFPS